MELPELGKHCAQDQCQQLDFLPLQCKFCGRVFCSQHLNSHAQTCVESRFLNEEELKKIDNVFVCGEEGCKERSVIPLLCLRCGRHYCIKHRHMNECSKKAPEEIMKEKELYAAPVRQFTEAKAVLDEQLQNKLIEAKKKAKHREMAAKVQLMKIKNKATGLKSIPTTDRAYFSITLGKDSKKVVPVFVSQAWSLGRVIDAVADECRLQNNNNKSTELKLRLFKKEGGSVVSRDLSCSLSSLLKTEVLINGEDLIIEYVADDCEVLC